MSPRLRALVGGALLVGVLAGCSTPVTGAGTLTEAKHRIGDLVNQTAEQLGSPVTSEPAPAADAIACRKHVLGYTISRLSTHRAEVTDPMSFTGTQDGA